MKKQDSFLYFLAAYGLATLYEKLPPELQQKIKSIFNLHHGTIGVIGGGIGVLTGNVPLMASGAGLVFHDRKDASLWKNDLERIVDSISKKIDQIFGQPKQQLPYITPLRLPNRF